MKLSQLVAVTAIAFTSATTSHAQDWYRETPASAPAARRFHALAFDPARAVSILFGGTDERSGTVFGDTWEFDGTDWAQRTATGPAARQQFAACTDRRGAFLIFGGADANGNLLDDTWRWNGVTWQRIATASTPAPRAAAQMVFDESRGCIVLFGGRPADPSQPFGDTWEFDGQDWLPVPPTASPEPRFGHAMTYDAARAVTVMFGGFAQGASGTSTDTWEFDGTGWRKAATTLVPSTMVFPSLTYHRAHGVAVLTGAVGPASQLVRTFAFDGTDWHVGPASPVDFTGRQGHATSYDSVRDAVVLFGGASVAIGGARPLADTWEMSARATYTPFGHGCATSVGVLEVGPLPGARPAIGRAFAFEAAPTPPAGFPLLLLGLDDRQWAGLKLPFDLTPLAMPGCGLFVSIEAIAAMTPDAGFARGTLSIPLDRSLLERELFLQVLVQGHESAMSNAGRLRLGN